MCLACEMREINILRHRIAARMREKMRAETVEADLADDRAAPVQPKAPADETPAAGANL